MPELPWIPDEDGDALTWTCHICRRERPDAQIAVWEHQRSLPYLGPGHAVNFHEYVRFCRDDAACRERAKAFHFVPLRPDEQEAPADA
jgi:hypothetical protein